MGGLQRVDGGVTAHEGDHRAFDRRVQAQPLHDVEVESRRIQARAAGHDYMGDALPLGPAQRELVQRATGQARSKLLKRPHAAGRRRKVADHVKVFRVAPVRVAVPDRFEERVTVLDGRHAYHAPEEVAHRSFGKHAFGECHKGPMDIVSRDCGGDAVNIGCRHGLPLATRCFASGIAVQSRGFVSRLQAFVRFRPRGLLVLGCHAGMGRLRRRFRALPSGANDRGLFSIPLHARHNLRRIMHP